MWDGGEVTAGLGQDVADRPLLRFVAGALGQLLEIAEMREGGAGGRVPPGEGLAVALLLLRHRPAEEVEIAGEDEACRCGDIRSAEHTSELPSRQYLVCRLLLEKKKN